MNGDIFKFKRCKDANLSYTSVDKHSNNQLVELFDTAISREDYNRMANNTLDKYPRNDTTVII